MRLFLKAIVLFTFIPNVVQAEWRIVEPGGHDDYISTSRKAVAIGSSGYHAIGLTCGANGPIFYTLGYPASPGRTRVALPITVDGTVYTVPLQHERGDGLFIGPAPRSLINAVSNGSSASITAPGQPRINYSLKGSANIITDVLRPCSGS
ncbi:MAG: hypothetical protein AAGB15_11920 [Pseudomonadota bacterium]